MSDLWGFATTRVPEVSVEAAMEEAAQGLISLSGTWAIVVAGEKGTIFYEWYRTSVDKERARLSSSDVLSLIEQARSFLTKVGATDLESLLLRTGDMLALVQVVGKGFLVVLADKSTNLAMLFLRARAVAGVLSRMLR